MRHSTELNQLRQRLSEIERKERELKIAQKDLGRKDREIGAEKSKLQTAFETIKSLDNEINRKQTMLDVQEKNLENLSKNISASKEVAIELLNTNYPSLARKLSIIPEDKVDALYETYNSISKKVHGNQKQLFERLEAMRRELEGRRADQVEVSNRHQRAIKKLEDIKREFDRARKIEQHLKLFKRIIEAYVDLQLRLRDEYVKYIASRTYLWYRKLVSYPQYVRVDFDPTDYMLLAQPVDSSKLRPVCMWSGGGHETIFALALRLALAEIFGHKDFLMLDEPTDATDPLNREAIIEALYEASQAFNQVLLVTHHEPVKELPVYAINVKYDEKERTSKIEVVQPA
jgi:DNA repair exonuclease SbcCD ATPase subunit